MFRLFQAVTARIKALFATDAALDLEAEFVARHLERKAELLRQAAEYEKEGLKEVAAELRQRAVELDLRTPLSSILPSIQHLGGDNMPNGKPLLSNHVNDKPPTKKRK